MPYIEDCDLTKTKTRCEKYRCRTSDFVLHRHHTGSEHMWLLFWQHRIDQPRFVDFARRYYEYRDEDVVRVCSSHHREIHEIYRVIGDEHQRRRGKPFQDYTWTEAEDLMQKFRKRCKRWLKTQSPGAEPWPSNGATKRAASEFDEYLAAARGEVPF
jgi:hypothetical protein